MEKNQSANDFTPFSSNVQIGDLILQFHCSTIYLNMGLRNFLSIVFKFLPPFFIWEEGSLLFCAFSAIKE